MILIPKNISEDKWKALVPQRDYAVLCNPDDQVFLKFGPGHGMVISVAPGGAGRTVNAIDFETGDPSLLGRVPADTKCILGRTNESHIKVIHAIISRQHLQLTLKGNILIVRDLGSTNGSFVLSDVKNFDIADYIEHHPPEAGHEGTVDWVHEEFGVTIDDFLKTYSQL